MNGLNTSREPRIGECSESWRRIDLMLDAFKDRDDTDVYPISVGELKMIIRDAALAYTNGKRKQLEKDINALLV